jgi:hypothetical protein
VHKESVFACILILEPDFELTLTNPYFISQFLGRKSAAKGAQWIAEAITKE